MQQKSIGKVAAILLIALCVTTAGCRSAPPLPPAAARLNDRGAEALAKGELDLASTRLSLALEYRPNFVEALNNLGLVEMQRGNFARAEQLLSRARRVDPDIAQPHHGLGLLAEKRFRPDEASEHYRRALALDPGFFESRANLARLFFRVGHFNRSLLHYQKLQQGTPKRLEGYTGSAHALLSLGRYLEAEETLDAARERFGEHPSLRNAEGRCLVLLGKLDAAETHLLPLAQRQDEYAVSALAWLAVIELARGAPTRAIGAAQLALQLEPEHPLASYCLAVALDDLDNPSAGAWLDRASSLNPEHPELNQRKK